MSAVVEETRALLAQFVKSPWRDLHVRTPTLSLFMAKPGGARNPIYAAATRDNAQTIAASAPHLGLFTATVDRGDRVTEGQPIGTMDVLGDITEVPAPCAGRITEIVATGGALVEYGEALIRIAAD